MSKRGRKGQQSNRSVLAERAASRGRQHPLPQKVVTATVDKAMRQLEERKARAGRPKPSSNLTDFERDPMMCGTCRVPVSRLTSPFGEQIWVHDRVWEDYDHDPEPVAASVHKMNLLCDFCGEPNPTITFEGPRLGMRSGARQDDYGTRWAACRICDPLIRRRSIHKIVERHWNMSATNGVLRKIEQQIGRKLTAAEIEAKKESERGLITKYVQGITSRAVLPPPRPPVQRILPARLPRVRSRLVEFWDGELPRKVISHAARSGMNLPGEDVGSEEFGVTRQKFTGDQADRFCKRMAFATSAAELFWISPAFTHLAIAAGKRLPDLTITREEVPTAAGLMVYGLPIHSEVWLEGRPPADLIAVGWTLVPGGVWLTTYVQPEQTLTQIDPEVLRRDYGFLFASAPGGGLPFGTTIEPEYEVNGYSIWGTLLATWYLMQQPGVTDERKEPAEKSFSKSHARAHQGRRPPDVRVVNLRKVPRQASDDEREPGTRVITVRSLVGWETGGFWRDQPYGLNHSLRRRIWIKPFARGPKDKPFAHEVKAQQATVKVLR